jgi:putative inorganic carbon (HCO3(-)) transporter
MTTSTTMSMSESQPIATLDRVTFALLLVFVASLQVSIAAANILLTALLIGWVAILVRDRTKPSAPRFFIPLLAYAAWTLLATLFSFNFTVSLVDDKQLVLLLLVPAVYHLARGDRGGTVVDVIVSVGAASAAFGIIQYGILQYDNLGQRPQGALTHYMTYSGVLMLVICAAVARLVFGRADRTWPALVMPALVVALALTYTRSATVGALAAVAVLLALKNLRLLGLVPIAVAVMFALAPDTVTTRMASVFNMQDPTIVDRLAMMRTGVTIIKSQPLTGIGPDMVPRMYVEYRDPSAVNAVNPHLHNVPLQIAAERGLPALAIWAWFVVSLIAGLWKLFRAEESRVVAAGGLAAVVAMLAAGMFEYNFGDSEFLMLFLVLVTLPFAAHDSNRGPAPAAR